MIHLFCDESGTAGDQYILVIGLLRTEDPDALRKVVASSRASHRLNDELHFWKHSHRKLALYDDVLGRVWEHDIRFEAMVIDKRFVDMSYFANDKYVMMNAFLTQALMRTVQSGDEAILCIDAREQLSRLVGSVVAEVNALKAHSMQRVEISDSKSDPVLQVCDLLTGVVHAFFEPKREDNITRKAAFARFQFARLLEKEAAGQARIWRWHAAHEESTPPPAQKLVSPPKSSSNRQLYEP